VDCSFIITHIAEVSLIIDLAVEGNTQIENLTILEQVGMDLEVSTLTEMEILIMGH